ncbi:MAG: hypothetical protein WAM60_22250 [Candidatus Promineifilaceae bacterium]
MERNESRMTWAIIIGLIVVGGLISAVWPTISAQLNIGRAGELAAAKPAPEPIVLDVNKYLLGPEMLALPGLGDFLSNNIDGREISQPMAIGILIAVTVGSLIILGGPLALIYTRLEKQASAVQEDEEYKAAVSMLSKRQKSELKERQEGKPSHIQEDPVQDRRGFAYTMAFLGIVFAWVVGTLIGQAVYGNGTVASGNKLINPSSIVSLIVLVITLAGIILYFRFVRKPEEVNTGETDYAPVSWGWVWVIVSGLLIVGIGTGLALNIIASGGAPPG